ncbi:MAG: hypothetical protein ACI8WB_004735 [Phenylobacterium sp.]|jgi:hypothetical protein
MHTTLSNAKLLTKLGRQYLKGELGDKVVSARLTPESLQHHLYATGFDSTTTYLATIARSGNQYFVSDAIPQQLIECIYPVVLIGVGQVRSRGKRQEVIISDEGDTFLYQAMALPHGYWILGLRGSLIKHVLPANSKCKKVVMPTSHCLPTPAI